MTRIIRLDLVELKAETGATDVSLYNYNKAISMGYRPIKIILNGNTENGYLNVKIYFHKKGSKHFKYLVFGGFNAGYGGEGPYGLTRVLSNCYATQAYYYNNIAEKLRVDEVLIAQFVSKLDRNKNTIINLVDNDTNNYIISRGNLETFGLLNEKTRIGVNSGLVTIDSLNQLHNFAYSREIERGLFN